MVGFCEQRVKQEVAKDWQSGNIELRDSQDVVIRCNGAVPALTVEEVKAVPGGLAAHSKLKDCSWAVCYISGSLLKVKTDHTTAFRGNDETRDAYEKLAKEHIERYESALCGLGDPTLQSQSQSRPESQPLAQAAATAAATTTEYDSEATASALRPITRRCPSAISNVELLGTAKGDVFLLTDVDEVTLPAWSHLGGFGNGGYGPRDVTVVQGRMSYSFPLGDKTVMEVDTGVDGTSFKTDTAYNHLRSFERQGHTGVQIERMEPPSQ